MSANEGPVPSRRRLAEVEAVVRRPDVLRAIALVALPTVLLFAPGLAR